MFVRMPGERGGLRTGTLVNSSCTLRRPEWWELEVISMVQHSLAVVPLCAFSRLACTA